MTKRWKLPKGERTMIEHRTAQLEERIYDLRLTIARDEERLRQLKKNLAEHEKTLAKLKKDYPS
jgi:uncharacterized coiled-coil protein SlyX